MVIGQPRGSYWHHGNDSYHVEARRFASSKAVEVRRSVEVAALEQKLLDTKRRHAKELARAMEADARRGVHHATSSVGPVLAARRRFSAGLTVRLWVEDCAASARVHAMDEASGHRTHIDVPDSTLSAMIKGYQCGQAGADHKANVDEDCGIHRRKHGDEELHEIEQLQGTHNDKINADNQVLILEALDKAAARRLPLREPEPEDPGIDEGIEDE